MHHLLLVTTEMPEGSTSEDARRKVFNDLMNDDSFCGEGGRFGSPLCDWFVIGGRWTGCLSETTIGNAYKDAVIARFPTFAAQWLPTTLIETHGQELDSLWVEHGGTGPSPYTRSGFAEYDDDAMVITQKLYDALLAKYAGQDECREEFVDLDVEPMEPSFVGRKWLVVIDYHN